MVVLIKWMHPKDELLVARCLVVVPPELTSSFRSPDHFLSLSLSSLNNNPHLVHLLMGVLSLVANVSSALDHDWEGPFS